MSDEDLLRQAEEALTEIDRNTGLIEEHASLLAALRIRLFGAPKQTLDDVLKAAGDIRGKRGLEDLKPPPKQGPSLEDVLNKPQESKDWPSL
ncbi:MAG: hypothetical protein ACR2FO_02460 [Actinomycetota bacterium]